MTPHNSDMIAIIKNWLPNAEGFTRESHFTRKTSDELSVWLDFFKTNPTRQQVLQECCRKANAEYCNSLEEVFMFWDIALNFEFSKEEWFDNPHKVDPEAWFYGMSHFDTVLGNEKDFTTPCHYED